jgi:hypothetical protein
VNKYKKAKHSIVYTLKDALETGGYTVYQEADLTAGTVPVYPYIYLVEWGMDLSVSTLPMIQWELGWKRQAFELGTAGGHYCKLVLHILGRSRGERDGLASLITENVTAVEIRDPDDADALVDTQSLDPQLDGTIWDTNYIVVPKRLQSERSLGEWIDLTAYLWIMRTEQ